MPPWSSRIGKTRPKLTVMLWCAPPTGTHPTHVFAVVFLKVHCCPPRRNFFCGVVTKPDLTLLFFKVRGQGQDLASLF